MKEFLVSADLDMSGHYFVLERYSVAFRCLLARGPRPHLHLDSLLAKLLYVEYCQVVQLLQALNLGLLEFQKSVYETGIVQVWQKPYPSFHKHVPSGVARLMQKYAHELVYTDNLSYDPKKLQQSS